MSDLDLHASAAGQILEHHLHPVVVGHLTGEDRELPHPVAPLIRELNQPVVELKDHLAQSINEDSTRRPRIIHHLHMVQRQSMINRPHSCHLRVMTLVHTAKLLGMGQPQPAVVILGAPGLWKATPKRYPCDDCGMAYPIQSNTLKTVRDARKTPGRIVIVLCWDCYKPRRHVFETPGHLRTGADSARRMMGLDS